MAGPKLTKACPNCGNVFPPKRLKQTFCSKVCSNRAMRAPAESRFWKKVEKTDGCWLWTGLVTRTGYGTIRVKGRATSTHRFSWEIHFGQIPEGRGYHGTCVCHHCDVRNCVRPEHLFLGTNLDNTTDRDQKGRRAHIRGERIGTAKVTAEQVLSIRADTRPHREIAADHGLHPSAVSSIKSRKNWKHVS